MKKVLSLVLVIAMVLSSMSFAFAGTFEDVTDDTTAKAVEALYALGVVEGNPDGTFKPENDVTRAEMAAMLVRALGHSDLAAGSSASFKDTKGKWYDGEVAVAQSLGLTNGYPDGTFKGENKVSYTEAITMIMRALGYNNKAVNSNRTEAYNATSYKTTAARLGILKNVNLVVGNAIRGDIAKMIYNALEVQVVVPDENGNPVGQWLTAPAVGTIGVVRTLLDDIAIRKEVRIGTDDLFGAHVADVSAYLGEKVVAYTNKDGKILFVKDSVDANAGKVLLGKVTTAAANTITVKKADNTSKDINVSGASIIINGISRSASDIAAVVNTVNSVKVVTTAKDGVTADVVVIESVTNTFKANAEYVEGKTKYQGITLPTTKDGKVNTDKIAFAGAASSLEDIEVNDVVQACIASDSSNIKFYVTRETVEGKVTEKSGSNYYVDGTKYALNANTGVSLSLGLEGTFYLDKDGNIAYASAKSTTVLNYGIIKTSAYNNGVISTSFGKESITKYPQVKMIGTDGKEKAYDVVVKAEYATGSDKITTVSATGFDVTTSGASVSISLATGTQVKTSSNTGTGEYLVKYSLNENGQITKVENATLGEFTEGKKTDAKFLAGDNTIVLGRDSANAYSVVDLTKLTDKTIGYQVVTNSSDFGWDLVIITSGIDAQSSVKTFAAVKSISEVLNSEGTATVQKVTAWVDGVEVSYITNSSSAVDASARNTVVSLVFNSSGLVTGVEAADAGRVADNVTATAINANGTVIKVNDSAYYTLSENVVVYKEPASTSGTVSVGDLNDIRITNGTAKVSLYDKDADGVIDVIYMHK